MHELAVCSDLEDAAVNLDLFHARIVNKAQNDGESCLLVGA